MRSLSHPALLGALGAVVVLVGSPEPALSQLPDSLQVERVVQEEAAPEAVLPKGITPRGAFIRSSLVPGWGHVEVGAYVRGAFYFTAEASTSLMIFKTQTRLTRTRRQLELRENVLTVRLQGGGVTDPGT